MRKETIIQELKDIRDDVVIDVASFQNNLNDTTSSKLKTKVELLKFQLKADMDTYVLDHALKL